MVALSKSLFELPCRSMIPIQGRTRDQVAAEQFGLMEEHINCKQATQRMTKQRASTIIDPVSAFDRRHHVPSQKRQKSARASAAARCRRKPDRVGHFRNKPRV